MGIANYVLHRMLNTTGVSQLLWSRFRRFLIRNFNDPPCSMTAHGRSLQLPLSHELPFYLKLLPLYDSLLERLNVFLHGIYGPLKCLDVGANIGDTIAALYQGGQDQFLAIEPNSKFNGYLQKNWNIPNVKILNRVCSSYNGKDTYEIIEKQGTASFYKNPQGLEFQTVTVDTLLIENPEFSGLNLIKVDTDGNDFAVLRGAKQALLSQPVVLFECDVFRNAHYVEDCLEILALFRDTGYKSMLLYEKFGYPMGCFKLDDLAHFKKLLFYQLTKKYIYFDILLMKEKELKPFYAHETNFFLDSLQDQGFRTTAGRLF